MTHLELDMAGLEVEVNLSENGVVICPKEEGKLSDEKLEAVLAYAFLQQHAEGRGIIPDPTEMTEAVNRLLKFYHQNNPLGIKPPTALSADEFEKRVLGEYRDRKLIEGDTYDNPPNRLLP